MRKLDDMKQTPDEKVKNSDEKVKKVTADHECYKAECRQESEQDH